MVAIVVVRVGVLAQQCPLLSQCRKGECGVHEVSWEEVRVNDPSDDRQGYVLLNSR